MFWVGIVAGIFLTAFIMCCLIVSGRIDNGYDFSYTELVKIKDYLVKEKEDYKSRCEKAAEYIKKHIEKCNIDGYEGKFDNFDIFTKPQKLIDILNGRSDE